MDASGKSIWIDLDNAPHVPLFVPIIRHFREVGVNVILTARDHAQTVELLRLKGLDGTFQVIGRHYGKSKLSKISGSIIRALELRSYVKALRAKGVGIALAVSHGSRSMVLAAKAMGIPILTMYDYEYTETRIFNRFSDKVMVPERIPDAVLDSIGVPRSKRIKYPGLKEELYIAGFCPDHEFRRKFLERYGPGDGDDLILAVVRPPATTANYHAGQSESIFWNVLNVLLTSEKTFTVVLPRSAEQFGEIEHLVGKIVSAGKRTVILRQPVNGTDLVAAADLVISGGGTMNREAALLGVPVYSIFTGKQGALDAEMERSGVIRFIRDAKDVEKIELKPRSREIVASVANTLSDKVESFVIEQINSFLEKS